MFIDYQTMLKEYNDNMQNNLRGFTGGPPPFEDWVPYDDDPFKSAEELIKLAQKAKHEVITIKLSDNSTAGYMSDRAKTAQKYISSIVNEMKYPEVKVVGLRHNVLTVDFNHPTFHEKLISLEHTVNELMGERFDIQTLNIDDKNKRKPQA